MGQPRIVRGRRIKMSELVKLLETLDIRTINFLTLDFTDNHGNFKRITIDYPPENFNRMED